MTTALRPPALTDTRRLLLLSMAAACLLSACAAPSPKSTGTDRDAASAARTYPLSQPTVSSFGSSEAVGVPTGSATAASPRRPVVRYGSGEFVRGSAGGAPPPSAGSGNVTLNFESADLREVIKTIFEEVLQENYELDPDVRGVVTMHTTMPVSRESVLPILESILQSNGATLIRGPGLYKIVPAASVTPSMAGPVMGRSPGVATAGYGVQIVPLRYVAAAEMKKILDPFIADASKVELDETRNVLMLSGPRTSVNNMLKTIEVFDVDWFEGMSFALFPVEYADVTMIAEEISAVLSVTGQDAKSRLIKLIPVERMNALLAVTHQPDHLTLVGDLVRQFDQGTRAGPNRRLFIYNLRHAEAETISETLQDIFSDDDGGRRRRARTVGAVAPAAGDIGLAADGEAASMGDVSPGIAGRRDGAGDGSGPVSIRADTKNNALIVLASATDYRAVEAAISKLDVPARQVLIEATIAEVQLTDNMSYGIRWFFEWNAGGYGVDVGFGAPLPQRVGGDGLSMAIFNDDREVRVFFDILAAETSVKFLSAPQVVVVDNETANFRVGDQIPVVTRASQSTTSPDAPVVTEVEYRDTGTLLSVKPRINAGGVVTLDISQEVSNPGPSTGGANPPIAQRTINSKVVVQSGQTVVLGGLIRENLSKSKSGIPGLAEVPVVGGLFRSSTDDKSRTELIITVTPRVIENPYEYRLATDDLRQRVKAATSVERSVRR
jgi:general secretion pathway protein D